jgi:hypothetical protein
MAGDKYLIPDLCDDLMKRISPYSLTDRVKYLVNNELLSDVTFLVGIEKKKINAHKAFLSIGKFSY